MTRRKALLGLLGCGVLSKGQNFQFTPQTTNKLMVFGNNNVEELCSLDEYGNLSIREGKDPREVLKYVLNQWVKTDKKLAEEHEAEIESYEILLATKDAEINRLQKGMIEYPQRNTGGIA